MKKVKVKVCNKYVLAMLMFVVLNVCIRPVCASAEAYANILEGDYKLNTKVKSNMMLDVNGGSSANGANIQIYQNNYDSYAQIYRITHVKDGWHKICNVFSGKAVDVAGGSKKSGTNVHLYTYNGSDAQLWRFYPVPGGYYQIQNKLKCYLDVAGGGKSNGTNVCVYTKNSTNAQKWKLINEKQVNIPQGTYKINTKLKINMMLDVCGGGSANGTNIQIYHDNDDSMAQQFIIEHVKNGWYKILNVASNKVLDVESGSAKSGTNVRQYTYNGTGAQLWRFYSVSDGYHIRNKLGHYLDVNGGSTADGANVQVYMKNSTNAQKWKLIQQVPPTKVTLDVSVVTLEKMGASKKITAKITPTNATQKTIKWSTSNDKVATVAKDGTIKAVGNGEATITAATTNGKTAKVQVKVNDGCEEIKEGFYSLNTKLASNMMLDVADNGAVDGANVQIWASNDTNAQKFHVHSVGNGWYELVNTYPSKCLDVAGGSNWNGANVQIHKQNATPAQKWRFYRAQQEGYYYIMNQSGRYLDVYAANKNNGANVVIWDKNNTDAQKWKLVQTNQKCVNIANGLYRISAKVGKRLALDVAGGGLSDGTNIQIHEYNDSMAQMYTIKNADDGWYKIINPFSGKCLDVAGAGTNNGTNVQLHSDNGTAAQKWRFYPSGDGEYFIIKSKVGVNLCLDVAGGGTKNGTNVAIWEQNGSAAQKWGLTETKIIELRGIGLNAGDFTLKVGMMKNLSVSYEPSNASAAGTAISWTTSNASVARVTNGVVTAVGPGSARIMAQSYNGKTASVTVTVPPNGFDPIWPCQNTYRVSALYKYSNGQKHSTRFKYGIDIPAPKGENVLAVESGKVICSEYSKTSGFGNWIMIRHNNGKVSLYAHLSERFVTTGNNVTKGQRIGQVGNTSAKYSIGPHLHFELGNSNSSNAPGDPWEEYYKKKYNIKPECRTDK